MRTNINLSNLTTEEALMAEKLVSSLSVHFETELCEVLLEVMHHMLYDDLGVEKLSEIAGRFGIDIEEEYMNRATTIEKYEEEFSEED